MAAHSTIFNLNGHGCISFNSGCLKYNFFNYHDYFMCCFHNNWMGSNINRVGH